MALHGSSSNVHRRCPKHRSRVVARRCVPSCVFHLPFGTVTRFHTLGPSARASSSCSYTRFKRPSSAPALTAIGPFLPASGKISFSHSRLLSRTSQSFTSPQEFVNDLLASVVKTSCRTFSAMTVALSPLGPYRNRNHTPQYEKFRTRPFPSVFFSLPNVSV